MGTTREVYEEKLRNGNLYHDPTINPGLGSAHCLRCLSLLSPDSEKVEWTITSVLHDATSVAGSGIVAMLGAVHGFNTGIPFLQNHIEDQGGCLLQRGCQCCFWKYSIRCPFTLDIK